MEHQAEKVKINIDDITNIPDTFPEDFNKFCRDNHLKPPKVDTGNGKALSIMLNNPNCYLTRKECDEVTLKFNIDTSDSIQLFNKHEQWGLKCSDVRGKYYVEYPYKITNKPKMRKNFKYDGTEESKNSEINNIKSHIMSNYIDVPNDKWQLGHKNPDIEDNTNNNLVLQPPIQAKYRDNFIFMDTLTKTPTPKYLIQMIEDKSPYSKEQLKSLKDYFTTLEL